MSFPYTICTSCVVGAFTNRKPHTQTARPGTTPYNYLFRAEIEPALGSAAVDRSATASVRIKIRCRLDSNLTSELVRFLLRPFLLFILLELHSYIKLKNK